MSTATSDAASILIGGVAVPVRVRRLARSRGYRLSIDPATGGVRLSIPVRANLKKALGWAQGQEGWVDTQLAAAPAPVILRDGSLFPLEGRSVQIVWSAAAPRRVTLEDDVLHVGGPEDSVGPRVVRWLKARAKDALTAETRLIAEHEGLPLTSVRVGDPRSRWGSCTASGAIRYSWRLILAPPDVRSSTVAHELAHLLHMDHSPAFHAAHARILGADPRPARQWLREHGAALHRITA